MRPDTRHAVIGLALAPLVGSLVWGVLMSIVSLAAPEQIPTLLILSFMYFYPAGLLLGLPALLLYRYFGLFSLKSHLTGGLVGGIVLGAALFLSLSFRQSEEGLVLVLTLTAGVAGAAAAGFFWWFAVRETGPAA